MPEPTPTPSVDDAFRKLMATNPLEAMRPREQEETDTLHTQGSQFSPRHAGSQAIHLDDVARIQKDAVRARSIPVSAEMEYEQLATRLSNLKLQPPALTVSALRRNEGSSTTALQLACCFARSAAQTVALVELDFGNNTLASQYDLSAHDQDLAALLAGESTIQKSLCYNEEDNLFLLASSQESVDAEALLSQPYATQCIHLLHRTFDLVVYDCPPCPEYPTAELVGPHTGGLLFAVRGGTPDNTLLTQAISHLRPSTQILGLVQTFM